MTYIDYKCDQVSSEELNLAAPIPKILINQETFDSFSIALSRFRLIFFGVSSKQHRGLSISICNFIQNRKFGESEDGIHGRDNFLLEIICYISGMEARRNCVAFSSKNRSRTDVYLSKSGLPPLVHVEEKANSGGMRTAQIELSSKFVCLPHYDREIQFIIGIAIAGDDVIFGKLHFNPSKSWERLNSFHLREMSGTMECIRAAINVGRWARYVLNRTGMLCAVDHILGKADVNERRSLTLLSEGIIVKKYFRLEFHAGAKKMVMTTSHRRFMMLARLLSFFDSAVQSAPNSCSITRAVSVKFRINVALFRAQAIRFAVRPTST